MIRVVLVLALSMLSPQEELVGQEYSVEHRWSVGAVDGGEHELWSRIIDAAVVDDIVFVLDFLVPTIRRFDMDGQFLGNVGRVGSGPGEYARPSAMEPFQGGVLILDQSQGRVSRFNSRGSLIDVHRLRVSAARIWQLGDHVVGLDWQDFGQTDTSRVLAWALGEAEGAPHVIAYLDNALAYLDFSERIGRAIPAVKHAGWLDGDAAIWRDSVVAVVRGDEGLALFEPAEGGGWELRDQHDLPTVRRDIQGPARRAATQYIAAMSQEGLGAEDVLLPERWPAWMGVIATSEGIWLREGGIVGSIRGQHPERWWVWTPGGGARLGVILPEGVVALRFIGMSSVLAKSVDELGVETLHFLDLVAN